MIAVFLVVTIEMTFSTMNGGSMGSCHSGPGLPGYVPVPSATTTTTTFVASHNGANSASTALIPTILEEAPDGTVRGVRPAPRHRRSASIGTELQKIERGAMGMGVDVSTGGNDMGVWDKNESDDSDEDDSGDAPETRALNGGASTGMRPRSWSESSQWRAGRVGSRLSEDQQQQKQLLQVMLLEAGILFHSVFIGKNLYPPRKESLPGLRVLVDISVGGFLLGDSLCGLYMGLMLTGTGRRHGIERSNRLELYRAVNCYHFPP